MVASPTDFAVRSPDDASIVAMDTFDEDHNPSPSELSKVVVPSEHTSWVPLKSPALTGKVIVPFLYLLHQHNLLNPLRYMSSLLLLPIAE